jgi:hypothetical protein
MDPDQQHWFLVTNAVVSVFCSFVREIIEGLLCRKDPFRTMLESSSVKDILPRLLGKNLLNGQHHRIMVLLRDDLY